MEIDRENPSPLTRLPGAAEAAWQAWGQELDTDSETAYLQQLAGVDRLEDATTLQLVVNTAVGGSIAHLGSTLPNLLELNLNGSALDSLRDLGTGFRLLQVLWVSRCGLTALDGLNGLPALRELYAAYNDISDLQPVDACQHLEVLDLECNCIPDTDAVLYLAACSNLQTLTLTGNPAADHPQYRAQVIAALPSLTSLDDEPVHPQDEGKQLSTPGAAAPSTTSHASSPPHESGSGRHSNSALTAGYTSDVAPPSRSSQHSPLAPPAFKAAAAAVEASYTTALLSPRQGPSASTSSSGGGATNHNRPPDTISPPAAHAPSTQLLPAGPPGPQDADEVALVVAGIKHARVGVDSQEFREIEMNMLVATADGAEVALDARPGTGGLMPSSATTWMRTLRSSREGSLAALRASQQAAACSGTHSPSSACSASPSSSRPPSSQQQQQQHQPADRWALPVGHSLGHNGGPSGLPPGGGRPSSGTGAPPDGVGRPGSGGYRPASASRPFSARPGTAASMGGRMGTASSVGAAPSASLGLYWAKNRLGSGGAGGEGQGTGSGGGAGALLEMDLVDGSSRLTQGTGTSFGGSLAKDLRKWKGAAVVRAGSAGVASAAASGALTGGSVSGSGVAPGGGDASSNGGSAGANGNTVAVAVGGGTSLSLSLLRGGQLDPHALLEELKRWKVETADKVLLADPDGEHSGGLGGGPGWGADTLEPGGLGEGRKADILQLSSSHDGAPLEALEGGAGGGGGGGGAGLGALLLVEHGPEPASSPALPCSPQVPLGAPQGGRARKMVLSKVVRDMYTDSVGSSGASIGEVLSKRPVHPPRGQLLHGEAAPGQQQGQGQQQQQAVQRVGSGRSGCSSSGQSDYGLAASYGGHSYASRPGSREEGAGGHLQYQRLGTAKGTPGSPGPGQYRVSSVAGELDVRSANPQPRVRRDDSDED